MSGEPKKAAQNAANAGKAGNAVSTADNARKAMVRAESTPISTAGERQRSRAASAAIRNGGQVTRPWSKKEQGVNFSANKRKEFRPINDKDYESVSSLIAKEVKKYPFLKKDKVAVRSMLMDELNSRGIKWFGKEDKNVIANLLDMTMEKAK